jgi:hypothetical protein
MAGINKMNLRSFTPTWLSLFWHICLVWYFYHGYFIDNAAKGSGDIGFYFCVQRVWKVKKLKEEWQFGVTIIMWATAEEILRMGGWKHFRDRSVDDVNTFCMTLNCSFTETREQVGSTYQKCVYIYTYVSLAAVFNLESSRNGWILR